VLRFAELERKGAALAAFSGKEEGDAQLPKSGAGPADREAICRACGFSAGDLVLGRQVHGSRIAVVAEADRGRGGLSWDDAFPETDALITTIQGLPLAVLVADCVPVYLLDAERPAICLAHAGRVGTFQGIAARAVEAMIEHFGCQASSMHAIIGPSAGPDRYEVSEEIAREWQQEGLPAKGRLLYLWEANARQLAAAGLPRENIHVSGICTISDERFHSHRRDADGRRNMAILML
jgi:hypothetical protein